jgi:hypothetical protein
MYLIFKHNSLHEQRVTKGFDASCGQLVATARNQELLDKYLTDNRIKLAANEEIFVVEAVEYNSRITKQ